MNAKLQFPEYACERLNLNRQALYRLIRENVLREPAIVRLGRKIMVNPEGLEAFIASGGAALPGGWRKEADL